MVDVVVKGILNLSIILNTTARDSRTRNIEPQNVRNAQIFLAEYNMSRLLKLVYVVSKRMRKVKIRFKAPKYP